VSLHGEEKDMAQDKRKFEERIYKCSDGREVKYKVYFTQGRGTPAIEEGECVRLAQEVGCSGLCVSKAVQAFEDNMFYAGKQKTTFGEPKILDGPQKGEDNPNYTPTSMRYIAFAECTGPDGKVYEDLGSAAPDNVEMLKMYLPEMAVKRARVRCLILALGLKGLNADAEFPDAGGTPESAVDSATAEKIVEARTEKLSRIQAQFKELGLEKTDEDLTKKKALLKECGITVPHNKMSVEELDKFVTFLDAKIKETK
jgi:hypothetical protein